MNRLLRRWWLLLAAGVLTLTAAGCITPPTSTATTLPAVCHASASRWSYHTWRLNTSGPCAPISRVLSYATLDTASVSNQPCPNVNVALPDVPCWRTSHPYPGVTLFQIAEPMSSALRFVPNPGALDGYPFTVHFAFPSGTPPRTSEAFDCGEIHFGSGPFVRVGTHGSGPFPQVCAGAVPA